MRPAPRFRAIALTMSILGTFLLVTVGSGGLADADRGPRPGDRVPGSFIVTLRDGVSLSQAREVAERHGGLVQHTFRGLHAFLFAGPDGARTGIIADRRVASIEDDRVVGLTSTPTLNLNHLTRTNAYDAYNAGYTGAGVSIAIIDTGVYKNHPVFHAGQVVSGKSCVGGGTGDGEGHGTATASNAAGKIGIAHDATIVPVRVFKGASLSTTIGKVVCGLNWVDAQNGTPGTIDVVNMSLAFPGGSIALRNAVQDVQASGAVVVAAAGNNGGVTQAPAKYDDVIAVSALAGGDHMASFSASGGVMTAPGVNVKSAENGGGYAKRSGTSRSSPMVAGAAAIVLAEDPLADVRDVLRTSGTCPNDQVNGGPGFCSGNWAGDSDGNAEPLVNAYCAGILADAVATDVPTCGF